MAEDGVHGVDILTKMAVLHKTRGLVNSLPQLRHTCMVVMGQCNNVSKVGGSFFQHHRSTSSCIEVKVIR